MSVNKTPGKLRFTNQGGIVFGDTIANDTVLEEGWLAIDTDKEVINIHDGVTKGGIKQVKTAPYPDSPAFPVFVPDTIGGTPQTATIVIPAGGPSQSVALPAGNYLRLTWTGSGPFAYRQGDSAVVALSTDTPAIPGYGGVILKTGTYIAAYGIGGGSLIVEGGEVQ